MPKPYDPKDKWTKKAKIDGYRARSVYKLIELDNKFGLIKPGMTVLDIGAAPGSWMQYTSKKVSPSGKVIGLDIQEIKSVADNTQTYICDILNSSGVYELLINIGIIKFDLILSDIAPSTTGIKYVDQKRSIELNQSIVDIAHNHLISGGKLIMKVFQGEDFQRFYKILKGIFRNITAVKVEASRDRSKEIYLICSL